MAGIGPSHRAAAYDAGPAANSSKVLTQTQLADQVVDDAVAVGQELRASINQIAVAAVGTHAPADSLGRFQHRNVHAKLRQTVRRCQAGDSRAHDYD